MLGLSGLWPTTLLDQRKIPIQDFLQSALQAAPSFREQVDIRALPLQFISMPLSRWPVLFWGVCRELSSYSQRAAILRLFYDNDGDYYSPSALLRNFARPCGGAKLFISRHYFLVMFFQGWRLPRESCIDMRNASLYKSSWCYRVIKKYSLGSHSCKMKMASLWQSCPFTPDPIQPSTE